jgi:hypothetical protein
VELSFVSSEVGILISHATVFFIWVMMRYPCHLLKCLISILEHSLYVTSFNYQFMKIS